MRKQKKHKNIKIATKILSVVDALAIESRETLMIYFSFFGYNTLSNYNTTVHHFEKNFIHPAKFVDKIYNVDPPVGS